MSCSFLPAAEAALDAASSSSGLQLHLLIAEVQVRTCSLNSVLLQQHSCKSPVDHGREHSVLLQQIKVQPTVDQGREGAAQHFSNKTCFLHFNPLAATIRAMQFMQ